MKPNSDERERRKKAFQSITEEDHVKVDAEFKKMMEAFEEKHKGFSIMAAMISKPDTTIHCSFGAPPQFLIHAALQLLFATLGQINPALLKATWDDTIKTSMEYSPEFIQNYLFLKLLMSEPEEGGEI